MISDQLARVLARLAQQDRDGLARDCAAVLGVDGIAVSLVTAGGQPEPVWSTGGTSARFEDLQFTVGQGPGPDAAGSGAVVLVSDLARTPPDRWPGLLPPHDLPVRAVFCFPMSIGAIRVGVLTGVRATPGPMSAQQAGDAVALAAALTVRFLDGDGWWGDAGAPHPATGLHRAVVHQATGMLSVQLGVPLGEALLRLRAHAYSRGRPIDEVARDVVARRLRLNDDGDGRQSPDGTRG